MSPARKRMTRTSGRRLVMQMCELILQMPLQWTSLLSGVNPKSILRDITGLSKSRIAQGSFDNIRQATVDRVRERSLATARAHALGSGWSEREFDACVASMPLLSDGASSAFGWLFHWWQETDALKLSETIRQCAVLEEFVIHVHRAAKHDELEAALFAALDLLHAESHLLVDSVLHLVDWASADDWAKVQDLLDPLLIEVYQNLFATLDAEWGAQYFLNLEPQPVLLMVAPVVDAGEHQPLSGRNAVRRPVRSLIELSHAIAVRGMTRSWPSKPPGRGEVGRILGISDAHAGNLFDGTRKLNAAGFETWWTCVTKHVRGRATAAVDMPPPRMLARVALLWQGYWIKNKGGKLASVTTFDRESYRRRWQAMRRRMISEFPPGQLPWAGWLVGDGLLSAGGTDWTDSSGRSS